MRSSFHWSGGGSLATIFLRSRIFCKVGWIWDGVGSRSNLGQSEMSPPGRWENGSSCSVTIGWSIWASGEKGSSSVGGSHSLEEAGDHKESCESRCSGSSLLESSGEGVPRVVSLFEGSGEAGSSSRLTSGDPWEGSLAESESAS